MVKERMAKKNRTTEVGIKLGSGFKSEGLERPF